MKFIGTKIINATPMTRNDVEALLSRIIGGDKHGDGYLVTYEDGYQSWSPKEVFDRAYRPVSAMTFGDALVMLKEGKRVCRAGWNGKGMWIEMTVARDYSFSELLPHFVIKNVSNSFSTWVPSINDCLAEDWMLLEQ